jgi:hypothetical protein
MGDGAPSAVGPVCAGSKADGAVFFPPDDAAVHSIDFVALHWYNFLMVEPRTLRNCLLPFFLIVFLCAMEGCVDLTLRSAWKDHDIAIDGKDIDWRQEMVKERSIAFAACNDAENLYLCLSITDKMTKAQMLGLFKQDFYVWFDPQGKKRKTFGLKFTNNSSFMDEELLGKMHDLPVHVFQVVADEMMKNLTIEVVQNYYPVAPLSEAKGIDVGVGMAKDGRQLTYELKIPLQKSAEHPFAIGAVRGRPVFIGLETSPIDIMRMRQQLGLIDPNDREGADEMRGRRVRRAMPAGGINALEAEAALERFSRVAVWSKVILAGGS